MSINANTLNLDNAEIDTKFLKGHVNTVNIKSEADKFDNKSVHGKIGTSGSFNFGMQNEHGEQFVNAVSDWIKEHTRAKSLIGYIPSHRQDVKQLAEKTFTHIGTITEAQSWDDKLIDVEIYQRIL